MRPYRKDSLSAQARGRRDKSGYVNTGDEIVLPTGETGVIIATQNKEAGSQTVLVMGKDSGKEFQILVEPYMITKSNYDSARKDGLSAGSRTGGRRLDATTEYDIAYEQANEELGISRAEFEKRANENGYDYVKYYYQRAMGYDND